MRKFMGNSHNKTLVLTGAAGFVGAHFLDYILEETDWDIVCIDSFKNKGTYRRLQDIQHIQIGGCYDIKKRDNISRVTVLQHDLSVPIDPELENLIMNRRIDDRGNIVETPIDYIVNLASDSAVERSISDPVPCLNNNINLMINMLEFARRIKPKVLLQCSTDEVFGEALDNPHKEWTTHRPSNPYAASKACQENICVSYARTYDLPIIITNTMNMFGEGQDKEKFIPKIISSLAKDLEIPIYVDESGKIGSRVYLHAKNYADACLFLLDQLNTIKEQFPFNDNCYKFNVCGDTELNNLEVAQIIAKTMNKKLKHYTINSDKVRKGYDKRYALDGTLMKYFGWEMPFSFDESIKKTIEWTMGHPQWMI